MIESSRRRVSGTVEPYIPASQQLKEITVKAVVLGFILSAVLAGANAYLGLKVGLTVSASIPAAVISMAVLRFFRESNILENNIVQTAASAGESLAAGVIFTLPALIMLQYWQNFEFIPTMAIALCGGILGVLFTIPLRRALIIEANLKFPEGVATGEVLKAGTEGGEGVKYIAIAGLAGAFVKLCQTGFKVFSGSISGAFTSGRSIFGYGSDLSVALLAVGYIVGLNIATLVFAGGLISWLFGIPIFTALADPDTMEA
ncbi:MAG TPA: oligopeptide transporter, OPT family, partial [Rhodothermales bacterium]|nr:oligopeptide transporter, OPT family [Rhodothermales bacterium]